MKEKGEVLDEAALYEKMKVGTQVQKYVRLSRHRSGCLPCCRDSSELKHIALMA